MRVLVTGGSGFFGAVLSKLLVERGHSVRVFDLVSGDGRPPEAEFIRGDILDKAAVRGACAGVDWVFHNVAQVPLAKDRDLFWSVNRDGTENLLLAAAEAKARKVVYTSSSAVFGVPERNPVSESMTPRPQEDYGAAKLAGEELCRRPEFSSLEAAVIRPRTILGPGRLGIFSVLFEWVARGRNIPVLGRGDSLYQFVDAADLAEACLLAAQRPGPGTYHCGTDRFGSMRDMLESLCAHAKTGSRVRSIPKAPAVALMRLTSLLGFSPLGAYHSLMYGESFYFDVTKARRELGWRPRRSNAEMIAESFDWYAAHRQAVLTAGAASAHRSAVKPGILDLVSRLL